MRYRIRKYEERDRAQVEAVCTGTLSKEYKKEPMRSAMLGVFCHYYIDQEPQNCFVAADENDQAVGYILCAADFKEWEKQFTAKYIEISENPITKMMGQGTIEGLRKYAEEYPAHLHIDILPEHQRKGLGTRLMDALMEHLKKQQVPGICLCVASDNDMGQKFYRKYGLEELERNDQEIVMGSRRPAERRRLAFNPYLPFDECIPDGEPHVFDDRVYIYGSHDRENGIKFCELDYEVFSAPVTDLSDWRSEGCAYRKEQDPSFPEEGNAMYAPDVVKGNDGRCYLYYALAGVTFTAPIHVAVSDSPAGPFTYYGCVRNPDGTAFTKNITFDPAVLNDEGRIFMYYGWALAFDPKMLENKTPDFEEQLVQAQVQLFNKTEEEVRNTPGGVMGAHVVELEDDMLTVKAEPVRIVPGQAEAQGTSFEGHTFFEASSIRRIKDTYYFIYSSQWQHELCYATSKRPDGDFQYGGVIISNGDIGYQGRKTEDRLAATGNNHGSIECINGEWYIFYHRQTHKNTFSRQGSAERIEILLDGRIPQVEMTSCGLNKGPLPAEGCYPAYIACNLTNGRMPAIGPEGTDQEIPYLTHEGAEHFIADISEGTLIGYKYFAFSGQRELTLRFRGDGEGVFKIYADEEFLGQAEVKKSDDWTNVTVKIQAEGTHALFFQYEGSGRVQLLDFTFCK